MGPLNDIIGLDESQSLCHWQTGARLRSGAELMKGLPCGWGSWFIVSQ